MSWIKKLQHKWDLKNAWQVFIVLVVFAATGFTVLFIKRPILDLIDPRLQENIWFHVLYYVLILPIYNIVLLFYGFIFGHFRFFWEFEKRFFKRIFGR